MREVGEVLRAPEAHPEWARRCAEWIATTVAVADPRLGRPGALCPFVPTALRAGTLYLLPCPLPERPREALDAFALAAAARFAAHVRAESLPRGDLLSYVVVFTALREDAGCLATVRASVKARLLGQGMTCGEFYPANPDTSVRNDGYLVARSPWPLLAIRQSTPHDELFLASQPELREVFLAAGPGVVTGRRP